MCIRNVVLTTMCHPWEEVPVWTEDEEADEEPEMTELRREVSPS